jgi:hypothetical protein
MPSTVVCPECGRDATVVGHLLSPGGTVEYLRVRCDRLLSLLVEVPEALRPRSSGCPVTT